MAVLILDDRDALDQAAASLAGLFADAELDLQRMLALQVKAGLAQDPDNVLKHLRLTRLRDAIRTIVDRLVEGTPGEVERILAMAAQGGTAAALRELSTLASVSDLTAITAGAPGAFAAQSLVLDLVSSFDDVTRRILRWPDDIYRQAVAGPTSRLLLGLGQTTRSAQARAWQQLISRGVTSFVDVAGRRWNLATYVEMATRTAARRAWGAQHEQTMLDHGMDLVSVIVGSDACQRCAAWAGKVLRINAGPTGRVRVPRADGPGDVVVDIAGTLDDARAAGWQHPNCRDRVAAFLPGLSVVADATTYDPELEADREKLRALERDVRKAKVEEAAAVTDEQRSTAQRRVRNLQAQIRDHVDTTGLNRKPYREQVSLGRRVIPDGPAAARLGRVVVPQARGFAPQAHEIATANRLAAAGHRVEFLVPSREPGARTPDILIDDQRWEMKAPLGSGKHTISNQLRRAGHQADRLVLDTSRTPLGDDKIVAEVRRRLRGPNARLAQVLVLRKNDTMILVDREP